jgi:hypothetical protein
MGKLGDEFTMEAMVGSEKTCSGFSLAQFAINIISLGKVSALDEKSRSERRAS